jgi:hypothetical protein
MVLIAALLLGTGLSAHADMVTYHNILKAPRNDDQLHQDGYSCDAQVGPGKNGVPTSAAYKRCMLGRGWRYQSIKREPAPKTWIDSDTGLTCHEILPRMRASRRNIRRVANTHERGRCEIHPPPTRRSVRW